MGQKLHRYIIFYKPYRVLSQFTDDAGRRTLAEFGFPKNVYSIGRLDYDSEGLLLLSDDGRFKHKLIEPKFEHPRTYLVQVERVPAESDLEKLRRGVLIQDYKTKPAKVKLLEKEPYLPPRDPPIRFRKNVPTAWIELTIYEGRNRQVRKMTAAIGFPTLRLIRIAIGPLELRNMQPGESRDLKSDEIALLNAML
ncbi:MAG TPA: pseudouridine synthase [Candidatus Kapabacteria bacterium]|nr:pseudouridine synthase [Candidatus Kapabacteria bacterium]